MGKFAGLVAALLCVPALTFAVVGMSAAARLSEGDRDNTRTPFVVVAVLAFVACFGLAGMALVVAAKARGRLPGLAILALGFIAVVAGLIVARLTGLAYL